jgi:hypothetical protein
MGRARHVISAVRDVAVSIRFSVIGVPLLAPFG